MSSMKQFAMDEMQLASIDQKTMDQVMALLDIFTSQGHSGFSANYALSRFEWLAAFEPRHMVRHAETELNRLLKGDNKDEYQRVINQDILQLLECLAGTSPSRASTDRIRKIFIRVARFKPLTPLTGDDSEWDKPSSLDNHRMTQQNKRCASVFRDNFDNTTAHDINGKVFIDTDGSYYTSRDSWIPVTFPYTVPDRPKYVHA